MTSEEMSFENVDDVPFGWTMITDASLLIGNPIGKKMLIFTFDGKIENIILPMLIL